MISENEKKRIQRMIDDITKAGEQIVEEGKQILEKMDTLKRNLGSQHKIYQQEFERFRQEWAFPVKVVCANPECAKAFHYLDALSNLAGNAIVFNTLTMLIISEMLEYTAKTSTYTIKTSTFLSEVMLGNLWAAVKKEKPEREEW